MGYKATKFLSPALWALALVILALPVIVTAQSNTSSASQPCLVGGVDFKSQFNHLFDWVPSEYCQASTLAIFVINLLLQFSGVVAVLFLVIGGFFYLTSAGNTEQAEKGKGILVNAVIGLAVIIMATAIVTIVSSLITKGQ